MTDNLNASANLTLQWAEKYISLGWSVIPLCSPMKKGTECSQQGKGSHTPGHKIGKTPLIPWQGYQTQRASIQQVQDWLLKWPEMNLGVVTGQQSSIVVVDLDGIPGMLYGNQNKLVTSVISRTGNGKQLFYKWTEHVDNSVSKIAPGVDIRADGGYVVVCPSVHPNGKRYRWERFAPQHISSLPTNLLNVKEQVPVPKSDGWIAKALEEMKIGNIDDTLTSVCGRLRRDGYTESDATILLQPHAERAGATKGHLEDKIRNVWGRYEPKAGLSNASRISGAMGSQRSKFVLHSPTNPDSIIEFRKRCEVDNRSTELETGYKAFDILTKGLKKGEVLTVAARTGVGKTNWIITPIRTFCEQGRKVLLFSTEMSFDQIWQRYIQSLGSSDEFQKHELYICDEFTPDIERIEEAINNVQPDLFIFDHISHIGTDYHIISKFMSEIKRLSRLYGVPAIVTAQLNRNADYVEQGQRIEPRLSMIQGSDQIGQMSAQVLLLNEKRVVNGETEIEGIVVKNRHGDRGMIQFILKREPYRMEENI